MKKDIRQKLERLKQRRNGLGKICIKLGLQANDLDGLHTVIDNLWPKLPATTAVKKKEERNVVCYTVEAKVHGLRVDQQLNYYALHGRTRFSKKYSSVDPCTMIAIITLEKRMNLKIIDAQFPLYDGDSGIRTRLDLLCVKQSSAELVLVEVKSTTHATSDAFLHAASNDYMCFDNGVRLPNSYYYRAMLQLLLTAIILKKEYDITADRSYLLRVNHRKSWVYELDAAVSTHYESIYNTIRRIWYQFSDCNIYCCHPTTPISESGSTTTTNDDDRNSYKKIKKNSTTESSCLQDSVTFLS